MISDFQYLCENHIDMMTYNENYIFKHEDKNALISIMYEAIARFSYNLDEVKWHTFTLLMADEIEIANKVKNKSVE